MSRKNRRNRKKQEQKSKAVQLNKSLNQDTNEDIPDIPNVSEENETESSVTERKQREPLSKKIRFEVFKRDSFKCQYCGRSAPDVILNVDHIIPVAAGGTNDIMNLITSCFDCNSGKGARQLSDNTIIQKQYNELEKLNERREQLEMMIEWRKGLEGLQNTELEYFESVLSEKFNRSLTEYGKKNVTALIKRYSLNELLTIIDIIYEKDIKENIINTMEKWARVREAENNGKPYLKDIFYIRKILDNRFELSPYDKGKILKVLEDRILNDYNIDWLKECAQECTSLWQFYKWLED
jgi:5-methylcytosine-specific restriction endonuclease McrA